ncbi:hypothetical protein PPYR_07697 [Photinus pyralis]|uniref:Uncharacterized protein n=1 Tax=Photinus pyralis TaxID=7054 RepID=A0A5N4AR62_PHOPY|nr:hypothetical protein PPYR_07697 [Photinus pyralis]
MANVRHPVPVQSASAEIGLNVEGWTNFDAVSKKSIQGEPTLTKSWPSRTPNVLVNSTSLCQPMHESPNGNLASRSLRRKFN